MATGVPTLSEEINTWFTQTWYEIRAEAIDNILDSTPVTALLKAKGCFKTQRGSDTITRTIRYGEKTSFTFGKGDTLPVTEEELKTQARWAWAYFGVPITRSFQDDQQNSGPTKITDYLNDRMQAARESLIQKLEAIIMASTIHAGGKEPLSLFDYVPDCQTTQYMGASYTYGGIARDNAWWQHEDFTYDNAASGHYHDAKDGPASLTMVDDMKNVYNTVGKQMNYPDIILTTQTLFEVYEDFAMAKEQIIKDETTRLADLGYDVLRFKGKPLTWSENMGAGQMLMLNSSFLDVVYDPAAWFEMTSWERPERQLEQVAYIVSAMQIVGYNPRFNGRIDWKTV